VYLVKLNELSLLLIHAKTGLRARIIPFMYVAGLHIEQDLLGEDGSYKTCLEEIGFTVDCLTVQYMMAISQEAHSEVDIF
jgi:cobalamin biosynthesis Co2+ chelatase CbiK